MNEQERIDPQRVDSGLTDYDDPERGPDDERFESGEEAIDETGRNPTQQAIDAELEGEGRFEEVDRPDVV